MIKILTPDIWYDRHLRLWTLLWKDVEGNQVGPAEYYPTKKLAQEWAYK
jgi:hypothetical protein